VFFDVSCERDEVLIDEVSNFMISVGLGFQPSTCASSRSGGKIDQERFVVDLCLCQGRIGVFDPIDEHNFLLQLTLNFSLSGWNDYRAVRL
jgi:hypothetical protein